ncbi:MAG: endolytic transglycosylase MltG [Candidatus Cloacimonadia bacterium]
MKLKHLLITFFIILLSFVIYQGINLLDKGDQEEVIVRIEAGDGASIIADKLVENGVLRSKKVFLLYIKLKGLEHSLSKGAYRFYGQTSIKDIVYRLENCDVILTKALIREGLTIEQTALHLQEQGFGDYEKYMELCQDSLFASTITEYPVNTLEGFLYPDTYFFPESTTEEQVLKSMVREFKKNMGEIKLPQDYKYSFYEVLTLASIVEKEAKYVDEKPLIASVYLNRLKIGQRLQADPTVAYALFGKGVKRTVIYYKDLEIDSPYNTYRNAGLPPTPICSPTATSLKAVLNPEESDYYYFFAGSEGRHIFSKTYREHLKRQNELKNRKTDA